jgi:hypothetical protein
MKHVFNALLAGLGEGLMIGTVEGFGMMMIGLPLGIVVLSIGLEIAGCNGGVVGLFIGLIGGVLMWWKIKKSEKGGERAKRRVLLAMTCIPGGVVAALAWAIWIGNSWLIGLAGGVCLTRWCFEEWWRENVKAGEVRWGYCEELNRSELDRLEDEKREQERKEWRIGVCAFCLVHAIPFVTVAIAMLLNWLGLGIVGMALCLAVVVALDSWVW